MRVGFEVAMRTLACPSNPRRSEGAGTRCISAPLTPSIPTVGIHSGVVDPVEWGPLGPNAVALRRNMTCSPCYLAKAEDCPRALACLHALEPNLVHETADLLLARVLPDRPARPEPVKEVARRPSSRKARGQPLTAETA